MLEVQKIAVIKAIRTLEAVKDHLEFAVEFDGKTFGNRELVAKRSRRGPQYPRGMTRDHYAPYFKGIKVGDVIQIPFGNFDPVVLAANVSAACVHSFGKGNATIHKNMTTKMVEVMLFDMDPNIDPKYRIDLRGAAATCAESDDDE